MATRRRMNGTYVTVREKSTSKGKKGTVMGKWAHDEKAKKKISKASKKTTKKTAKKKVVKRKAAKKKVVKRKTTKKKSTKKASSKPRKKKGFIARLFGW